MFAVSLQIMKEHVFNMKDPIIVGMEVLEGNLRVGTPLCIPALGGMEIGRVASIEQVTTPCRVVIDANFVQCCCFSLLDLSLSVAVAVAVAGEMCVRSC